jgi:hypothetical protein
MLALCASPVAAFDGRYGEACGVVQGEDVPIVVAGDTITFYESVCRMTNPVAVRDMPGAVLFDMQCAGEGEAWTERAFLQPAEGGGLILVWQGRARVLPRCP